MSELPASLPPEGHVPPGLPHAPPALPHAPPGLPHAPPATLAYANPGVYQRPKPRTPYVARLLIGCFGYILLTVGWIVLGAASPTLGKVAWSGWAAMTVALLGLSLYLRIRYGYSGIGVGILISFGVAVVIAALLVVGVVLLLISICGKSNNNTGGSTRMPTTAYPSSADTPPATEPATQAGRSPSSHSSGDAPAN